MLIWLLTGVHVLNAVPLIVERRPIRTHERHPASIQALVLVRGYSVAGGARSLNARAGRQAKCKDAVSGIRRLCAARRTKVAPRSRRTRNGAKRSSERAARAPKVWEASECACDRIE